MRSHRLPTSQDRLVYDEEEWWPVPIPKGVRKCSHKGDGIEMHRLPEDFDQRLWKAREELQAVRDLWEKAREEQTSADWNE